MLKLAAPLLSAATMLTIATPAKAGVLATCGGSYGKAHYDGEQDWTSDSVASGKITFSVGEQGDPKVLFMDTTGRIVDATSDGAEIHVAFANSQRGQFSFVVVYPDDGIVETYTVFRSADGKQKLHWTSNKASVLQPAKVAAFSSSCE